MFFYLLFVIFKPLVNNHLCGIHQNICWTCWHCIFKLLCCFCYCKNAIKMLFATITKRLWAKLTKGCPCTLFVIIWSKYKQGHRWINGWTDWAVGIKLGTSLLNFSIWNNIMVTEWYNQICFPDRFCCSWKNTEIVSRSCNFKITL